MYKKLKKLSVIATAACMLCSSIPAYAAGSNSSFSVGSSVSSTGISISTSASPKIKLNKKSLTLTEGKSATLKLKNTKKKASWKSSNKNVATVNKNGKVTAKKAGTVVITAVCNKKEYVCTVTVKNAPKVALNKKSATIEKGDKLQLTLKNTKKKARWSSSNKKVASVNSSGKVTAKKTGTATITAKLGNKKYKCKITVIKVRITKVDGTPSSYGDDKLSVSKPTNNGIDIYDINAVAPKADAAIRNAFKELGFRIEYSTETEYSGYFSVRSHSITLKTTGNVAYHELGHFLSWVSGNKDSSSEFANIYNSEKSRVTSANKSYITSSAAEYFAESYKDYVLSPSDLAYQRPNTYKYMEECVNIVKNLTLTQLSQMKIVYLKLFW